MESDIFECGICLDQFKEPKVVSCGHSFCRGCLEQLKPGQMQCPLCRTPFTSVEALPTNFVVLQWMETAKQQQKSTIPCQNCDKPASSRCEQCNNGANLCSACCGTLHSIKLFQDHKITPLLGKEKQKGLRCPKHGQEIDFYCNTDKDLVCQSCLMGDHKSHTVAPLFKYIDTLRADLMLLIKPLQDSSLLEAKQIEIEERKKKAMEEMKVLKERLELLTEQVNSDSESLRVVLQTKGNLFTTHLVLKRVVESLEGTMLVEGHNKKFIEARIKEIVDQVALQPARKVLSLSGVPFESAKGYGGIVFSTTAKEDIELTGLCVCSRARGNWKVTVKGKEGANRQAIASWPNLKEAVIDFLPGTPKKVWEGSIVLKKGTTFSWAVLNGQERGSHIVLSNKQKTPIEEEALTISTGSLLDASLKEHQGFTKLGFIGSIQYVKS
uniref:RING-type domain-containing protein n=1 Tax=Arcella intermedia TaxID=1963864 RepID=A0A6B2L4F4_9EUKA|eukprot:TRINITY_DN6011_c0_g1_i1.p1 TRINITY_DN6011_c0_g1~~TRINITY_DN6011_c0_g1_i1.p1  ORF type:complete len:439 (-),score=66.41 TRINITY_DN6011_c0_g1_i1:107-1423(-)